MAQTTRVVRVRVRPLGWAEPNAAHNATDVDTLLLQSGERHRAEKS